MHYIATGNITNEKPEQQFVDPSTLSISHEVYENWLRQRAYRLANIDNKFLVERERGGSGVT